RDLGESLPAACVRLGRSLVILEISRLHQLLHTAVRSESDIQIAGHADLVRLSRRAGDDPRVGRAVQRLNAIVAIESSVKLAGGSDGCGIPSRFLIAIIAIAGGILLYWARGREDGDGGFADGVAGLKLVSILEQEIELVGSNFHRLATALPSGTGLIRLGVLHHARVLHHVKPQGLVLVVEVKHKRVRRTMRNTRALRLEFSSAREDRL